MIKESEMINGLKQTEEFLHRLCVRHWTTDKIPKDEVGKGELSDTFNLINMQEDNL